MSRAIAHARTISVAIDEIELLRRIIVLGSAAALILAGRALPF